MTAATGRAIVAKRILLFLVGLLLVVCVTMVSVQLFSHPDSTSIARQQEAVLSSYLFQYPLVARPLPATCHEFQLLMGSSKPVEVRISNRTFSGALALSTLVRLPWEKFRARGVPLSTFNNFIMRNLVSSGIDSISGPANVKIEFLADPFVERTDTQALSVKFSEVGFDRDLSWAMFYSEVLCGSQKGSEYVYLTRDWKHGKQWYVAGVSRLTGSPITEQELRSSE
jgi:hypothetical protein